MDKEFYISLIHKSLAEGLSKEEQHQLDDWLATSEENRATAENIQQGWELSANYSKDFSIDLDDEFARLQQSMMGKDVVEEEVKEATIKTLQPRRTWLSIAAAILLLAVTYFVFNQKDKSTAPQFVTIKTQTGEIKELELADGTKVWINENSSFTYPTFFNKKRRKVTLNGLAFFDVAHNAKKVFSIETDGLDVKVLGTSFSVRAYKDEPVAEVLVKTGKVQILTQKNNIRTVLTPNKKGIFDKATNSLNATDAKSTNELSWHNNTLTFDDTQLIQVIQDLEKHYDVIINLKDTTMGQCPFSSIFQNKELSEVFNTLDLVLKLKAEKTGGKTYELKGGQCPSN